MDLQTIILVKLREFKGESTRIQQTGNICLIGVLFA